MISTPSDVNHFMPAIYDKKKMIELTIPLFFRFVNTLYFDFAFEYIIEVLTFSFILTNGRKKNDYKNNPCRNG